MSVNQVRLWLAEKVARAITWNLLGALVAFLAGIVALATTFGVVCWLVLSLFSGGPPRASYTVALVISAVFLALLWVASAVRDREHYAPYTVTTVPRAGEVVTFDMPGLGPGWYANRYAPDTLRTHARLIADVLCTGPRLVASAAGMLRKAARLRVIDQESAAAVLAFLLSREHRVAFVEIIKEVAGVQPSALFPSLRDIDGVLFLSSEPPGLALTSELREEMQHAVTD